MQPPKSPKQVIVVGDVHGQYEPFVKILQHAGLIDENQNWSGGHNRLVQMGDIFDRGPASRKVDDLLDRIQKQALQSQGEVIRLVGNHELEPLLSNFVISGFSKEEAKLIHDKLTRQVLNGELRAAYAYKGILFTHAGVTRKLYKIFQMQLDDPNAGNIASMINLIFRESIKHEFYKHPIFNISISRKGADRFGGIFWEDLEDLVSSYPKSPLVQVVGHTPVTRIILDRTANIIPVDVGMHRKLQYLVIDEAGAPIYPIQSCMQTLRDWAFPNCVCPRIPF